MTPDHLARIVHDAALEAAHRAEHERQDAARDKLLDPEVEHAVCCDEQAWSGLVLRGKHPDLKHWHQIRRLHPDGNVTVSSVSFCPFCGRSFHIETAA